MVCTHDLGGRLQAYLYPGGSQRVAYRAYGAIFLEFVKKMYKPIMYYINLGTWTITPSGWATNYTTEQNVEQLLKIFPKLNRLDIDIADLSETRRLKKVN